MTEVARSDGVRPAWLIALGVTLAHAAVIAQYGVFRDELYYVACSRRLAWGYVDHPPGVAVLAWAARALFGESLAALRVLPVLFGASTVLLTAAVVRRLGGGRFAAALAALAVAVAPYYLFTFHVLSMNGAEVLLWTLAAWLIVVAVQTGRPWPWLALGVVAGVGLLNKISMGVFGAGLAAGLLLTPAWRHFRTPWPWVAALLAAAIFAPHLLWQAQHGWPTAEFIGNAQRFKIAPLSIGAFLLEQVGMMHPLTAPLWLAGLFFFAVQAEGRLFRLFAWCYLVVLFVFVAQQSKPYYLTPIYPVLFAGGAVALERASEGWHRVRRSALALLLLGGLALAPLGLPVLPVRLYVAYQARLGFTPSAGERHELGALPQHYADMFGWEELAQTVSRVYQALPEPERATARVFAQNYGQAGAIERFAGRYPLPRVMSPHNNYWLWGPGADDGGTIIIIGGRREDHLRALERVDEAARTSCRLCMPYERDQPIWVGRGWKVSLKAIWPAERKFI